jgi:hypothetical protein
MRAMNAVATALLRSPLHGLMSDKVLLPTFSGRGSGKEYTTPMSYARVGDAVYMSTEAPWWKNLLGGAPVGMRLRGRKVSGVAEAITDPEGAEEGLRTILRHYPEYRRFLGVAVDEAGRPDPETVGDAVRRGRVVLVGLPEGAA